MCPVCVANIALLAASATSSGGLTASVEEIGQRLFAVRTVEDVFLVDLDHRQLATRGAERISLASEFLFSRQ